MFAGIWPSNPQLSSTAATATMAQESSLAGASLVMANGALKQLQAAVALRRGLQTFARRTPGIGTGAGRRGVTPRLSFRLIHSCSRRFTGGRPPGIRAARDAGGRRRTVVRSPRKRVKAQVFRGFKSHLHRH